MPEAGCRSRFLRIQYHAEGRDATSFRGESGPETAFRGRFHGGDRFGGQDYPAGCHKNAADKHPAPPPPTTQTTRSTTAARIAEYRRASQETNKQPQFKATLLKVH